MPVSSCRPVRPSWTEPSPRSLRLVLEIKGDYKMRGNSGSGKGKNNNLDPTLKEHERAGGSSGEAIVGERKRAQPADRTESRTESSRR